MTTAQHADRYRFNRRNDVVRDVRQPGPTVGTREYTTGDRLFVQNAPGSNARAEFKSERVERRRLARTAVQRAMVAVHEAATR